MVRVQVENFQQWREQARELLQAGVAPHQVTWIEQAEPDLFASLDNSASLIPQRSLKVPASALELLQWAGRYCAEDRWAPLYRVLWRVVGGDRAALLAGDPDGSLLHRRVKAVRREIHHLKAFVRFNERETREAEPQFVAWFEPAHEVLDCVAEHFAQRMGQTRWLIASPKAGVYFDGQQACYAYPCPEQWQRWAHVQDTEQTQLWQQYYRSIFNPARLNPQVMRGHMPTRFWQYLPEGQLMPQMISEARLGAQRYGQRETVAKQQGKRIASPKSSQQ